MTTRADLFTYVPGIGFGIAGAPATGTNPVGVATADFNGDGKRDIANVNYGANSISVFLNVNGKFPMRTDYPTGNVPISLALADLDGDGDLDVAAANRDSHNVAVLTNGGKGNFGAAAIYPLGANSSPSSIAATDLNCDGYPDLAVGDAGGTSVLVNLGPAGKFQLQVLKDLVPARGQPGGRRLERRRKNGPRLHQRRKERAQRAEE